MLPLNLLHCTEAEDRGCSLVGRVLTKHAVKAGFMWCIPPIPTFRETKAEGGGQKFKVILSNREFKTNLDYIKPCLGK